MALNLDESPLNAAWLHSEYDSDVPAYRSDAFFKWLSNNEITLSEFKQSAMYKRAVIDGLIENDKWVGRRRQKSKK